MSAAPILCSRPWCRSSIGFAVVPGGSSSASIDGWECLEHYRPPEGVDPTTVVYLARRGSHLPRPGAPDPELPTPTGAPGAGNLQFGGLDE